MENPHFKNQVKIEVEKTPQENEESLITQEQESGKRENITLEIDGQTIEAVKYYFEYPERIQKETGILGYERTKISNENISDFIKNFYLNKYNINVEDYGFKDVEHIGDFVSLNKARQDSRRGPDSRFSDKYLKSEQFKIDERTLGLNKLILRSLVNSLSNNEYPNKSFVHEMGADHRKNETKQEEYRNKFASDKFFLQKIYDLEYIKDQSSRGEEKVFDMANVFGGYQSKSHVTVFDSKTGEKMSPGDYIQIRELGEEKYYDGIKNGKLFACTPDSGFNVETGDSYFRHHFTLDNKNPFFGFPMDESSFFYQYLHKSLEIYVNKLKGVDLKKVLNMRSGIRAILQQIILSNPEVQKTMYEQGTDGKLHLLGERNKEKEKNILSAIEAKYSIKLENFLKEELRVSNRTIGEYELRIPIFIGLNDIPQLQWGHAKYAHYMNEKGFNFFKFKHADHLPKKEEVNSSEF